MKKVQDYYFKKARSEGYPARSVYKLIEAQKRFRFIGRGARVLDLGCHPGSWSMFAARAVGPKGLVAGVDLQPTRLPGVRDGGRVTLLCGDLNDAGVRRRLAGISPAYDVVLSDMAPKTTGNRLVDERRSLDLVHAALDTAAELLAAGGAMYCKVFEGGDMGEVLDRAREMFARVRTFKPKSSRPESREVFFVATGFSPPGRDHHGWPSS